MTQEQGILRFPDATAKATAFFQSGDAAVWFNELPTAMQKLPSGELLDWYKTYQDNERIAHNIETRADDLGTILQFLAEHHLTVEDLVVFERKRASNANPFRVQANFLLPKAYQMRKEENAALSVLLGG